MEDAETFARWLNDFQTTDYLGRSNNVLTIEEEKEWIQNSIRDKKIILSIIKKEDNKIIGNSSLFDINYINRTATIGIIIGEQENLGIGYGTENLGLILDFAFNYLNLNNIMLNVMEFNERAIKSYTKVGFKEFGRRAKSSFINGKYYDVVYMEILKENFTESYILNKNI